MVSAAGRRRRQQSRSRRAPPFLALIPMGSRRRLDNGPGVSPAVDQGQLRFQVVNASRQAMQNLPIDCPRLVTVGGHHFCAQLANLVIHGSESCREHRASISLWPGRIRLPGRLRFHWSAFDCSSAQRSGALFRCSISTQAAPIRPSGLRASLNGVELRYANLSRLIWLAKRGWLSGFGEMPLCGEALRQGVSLHADERLR